MMPSVVIEPKTLHKVGELGELKKAFDGEIGTELKPEDTSPK